MDQTDEEIRSEQEDEIRRFCTKYRLAFTHKFMSDSIIGLEYILRMSKDDLFDIYKLQKAEMCCFLDARTQYLAEDNKENNNNNNNNKNKKMSEKKSTKNTGWLPKIPGESPRFVGLQHQDAKIECFDKCRILVLNYCAEIGWGNAIMSSEIRTVIDNGTRSGVIKPFRYKYNEDDESWPNNPTALTFAICKELESYGIVSLSGSSRIVKSYGGHDRWKGIVTLNKLSDARKNTESEKIPAFMDYISRISGHAEFDMRTFIKDTEDGKECEVYGILRDIEVGKNEVNTDIVMGKTNKTSVEDEKETKSDKEAAERTHICRLYTNKPQNQNQNENETDSEEMKANKAHDQDENEAEMTIAIDTADKCESENDKNAKAAKSMGN